MSLNTKAEMGVGTLLIFIALLLVAAIAAGVVIQTTSSTQGTSITTSKQVNQEISTNLDTVEVSAANGRDGNLDEMSIINRLAPGSDPIKIENILYKESTCNTTISLSLRENALPINDVFAGFFTASNYGRESTNISFESAPSPEFRSMFPSPYTSAMMIGKTVVSIIFVESTDSAPGGNLENWTDEEKDMLVTDTTAAFNWWNTVEPRANLRHTFTITREVKIDWEPITIDPSNDDSWINDTIDAIGLPAGPSHFTRLRAYAEQLRNEYNAHWSFIIFMVDSNDNGIPAFPNGWAGYAYVNGPYTVIAADACSGCADVVIAHEMGHIYGTHDEYSSSGCTCDQGGGIYNIENGNCDNSCKTNITSIMGANSFVAFQNHAVSMHALGQLGLIDQDNNMFLDPIDHLFVTPNPGSGYDNQTINQLIRDGYDKPDFNDLGLGFYAMEYIKRGTQNLEGSMQKGDIVRFMHESGRNVGEDEEVRLTLIPKTGNTLVTQFITPQVISNERIYLYPLK